MSLRRLCRLAPALLLASSAAGQPVTFRAATRLALTQEPSAMAVGDLNNDQLPDVVIVNFAAGSVTVFLASSDGSLTNVGDFPAGGAGQGVIIRDLDGDTIPDILLSEEESDNLRLLHGFGDGTFGDAVIINSGHDPVQMAAADLDGDGVLDLAVTLSAAGEGSGRVSILRGLGGGTFDAPQILSLDIGADGVVIYDFDGDGAPDLAVTNSGPGTISILRNLGHLNFAAAVNLAAGSGTGPLVLGDVDGDGLPDLIAGNSADDTIVVLRNRGDGTFDPAIAFPGGGVLPSALAVADLNADGHVDVIVSQERTQSVSVLLGVGDGRFDLPRSFIVDSGPMGIAALDLNGDGKLDLLSADSGGGNTPSLALLFGDGFGRFEGVEQLPTTGSTAGVAVADFNEDGVADAAVAQPDARGVTLLFGADLPSRTVAIDGAATALVTADFDGDDHLDLATITATPDVSIVFGRGDGGFGEPLHVPLAAPPGALAVGDFDHDGAPDLVATLTGTPAQLVIVHNQRHRSFALLPPVALSTRPLALAVGDFDGDGNADVAVGDASRVLIFLGMGDNTFAPPTVIATGAPTLSLVVSDVDADGDEDLVVALSNQGQGGIRALLNDGHGVFTVGVTRTAGESPTALAIRDFDDDGIPELLAVDHIENGVGLLTNNGRGGFQFSFSELASVRPNGVATGDFNDDGVYDLVIAGETTCRLIGIGTEPVVRGDGNGDGVVSAADLVALVRELSDGDGARVDDVPRGSYRAHAGVDADGDGTVTRVDARAMILRLMHRREAPIVSP